MHVINTYIDKKGVAKEKDRIEDLFSRQGHLLGVIISQRSRTCLMLVAVMLSLYRMSSRNKNIQTFHIKSHCMETIIG